MDASIRGAESQDKLGQIIFIVGPTATGKSDLAVSLAEHMSAEIINADSIQFYNQIEIGTAKPSSELLLRAPHHLLSFVDPPHSLSAGDFTRAAHRVLSERSKAGVKNFIVVGGSGFYIQALEKGMVPAPEISEIIRNKVKLQFEAEGSESLWVEVENLDHEYAQKVSPKDSYRVQRALEILLSSPKSISQASQEFLANESSLKKAYTIQKIAIDVDRAELRKRVEIRTEQMLIKPWKEEVLELRRLGFTNWPPLRSVGYNEIGEYLDGIIDPESLKERIVTRTMQLAKKQRTWFKRDLENHWIVKSNPNPKEVFEEVRDYLSLRGSLTNL